MAKPTNIPDQKPGRFADHPAPPVLPGPPPSANTAQAVDSDTWIATHMRGFCEVMDIDRGVNGQPMRYGTGSALIATTFAGGRRVYNF